MRLEYGALGRDRYSEGRSVVSSSRFGHFSEELRFAERVALSLSGEIGFWFRLATWSGLGSLAEHRGFV